MLNSTIKTSGPAGSRTHRNDLRYGVRAVGTASLTDDVCPFGNFLQPTTTTRTKFETEQLHGAGRHLRPRCDRARARALHRSGRPLLECTAVWPRRADASQERRRSGIGRSARSRARQRERRHAEGHARGRTERGAAQGASEWRSCGGLCAQDRALAGMRESIPRARVSAARFWRQRFGWPAGRGHDAAAYCR